jgi:hypothetical protein
LHKLHPKASYIRLGNKEAAIAALQQAHENRHGNLNSLGVEPLFERLRDDPRFMELLRKTGLETVAGQ